MSKQLKKEVEDELQDFVSNLPLELSEIGWEKMVEEQQDVTDRLLELFHKYTSEVIGTSEPETWLEEERHQYPVLNEEIEANARNLLRAEQRERLSKLNEVLEDGLTPQQRMEKLERKLKGGK